MNSYCKLSFTSIFRRRSGIKDYEPIVAHPFEIGGPRWQNRDLVILLTPPFMLLVLVSSQMEFNHHVRYVLPVLGFAFVFAGCSSWWFGNIPGGCEPRRYV